MDAFIAWLRNLHPMALLLIAGFLLLPSLFVYVSRAGRRNFPAWLAAALVPFVGWLVVGVLLLKPERPPEGETVDTTPLPGVPWGRLGLGFVGLALVSTFAWKSDNSPPPLPSFDNPIIRAEIHSLVRQSAFEWLGKDTGALRIVEVKETPSNDPAKLRAGRVSVEHAQGQDFFEVTMIRIAGNPPRYQLAVNWDTREMLSLDYWQVRDQLRQELEQSPEVRRLELSDQQWATLKVTEKPSETPQSLRLGQIELPAGEGRAPQVQHFLVHWSNQAQFCPGIQLVAAELPPPSSPAFQHELNHAVQDSPSFAHAFGDEGSQITGLWMSLSDPVSEQRFYKVQIRLGEEEQVVSAVLQWRDRDLGLWEVKILDEPPAH
jgi:hypothetical protein